MTLIFTQDHRVTESWNLCSHSVVKLRQATQVFLMVDYVWEMTENSCMANMDHLSICSCCLFVLFGVCGGRGGGGWFLFCFVCVCVCVYVFCYCYIFVCFFTL